MNVISIYDGNQDATDVFVSLITEKMRKNTQDYLGEKGSACYNKDKVQVTGNRASGLCG